MEITSQALAEAIAYLRQVIGIEDRAVDIAIYFGAMGATVDRACFPSIRDDGTLRVTHTPHVTWLSSKNDESWMLSIYHQQPQSRGDSKS